MAAKTTYNVYSYTSKVVPFIALITANHVGLIWCPANTVELDRLVRVDGLRFNKDGLTFKMRVGYLLHLVITIG